MINVFTYGSLMFDQVWSQVVDGNYRNAEALLKGYERKALKGEIYPAICPSTDYSEVQGIVYFNVSPADLARLDVFEGEYYYRKSKQVVTHDKNMVPAEAYVLKEKFYPVLSNFKWDAQQFAKTDIHHFIENYFEGYRNALEEF